MKKPTTKQIIKYGILSAIAGISVATAVCKHFQNERSAYQNEIEIKGIRARSEREIAPLRQKTLEQNLENEMQIQEINKNPVNYNFIDKLIDKESTNNPHAESNKGARGLMQIMEPTWKETTKELYGTEITYDKAFDPKTNKEVGLAYLTKLDNILSERLEEYSQMTVKEKQKKIAAAYNGGITRLLEYKGDISKMPFETRDYVSKITN